MVQVQFPSAADSTYSNLTTTLAFTFSGTQANGASFTADAQATYLFVIALYETGQFTFEKLVPWLRTYVTLDSSNT